MRRFCRAYKQTVGLQPWSLLRKALIRAAKTSHTAGTLDAIPPKLVKKYIDKKWNRINN
jgi:hypothetical protein